MASALQRAHWTIAFAVAAACQAFAQSPSPPGMPAPASPSTIPDPGHLLEMPGGFAPFSPSPSPSQSLSPAPMPAPLPILPGEIASEEDPSALYRTISELYAAGQYDEAVPLAERLLESAERSVGTGKLPYANAESVLARLHQAQGHFAQAETLLQSALAIYEKERGPGHPDVASDLSALAQLYEDQGRLDEAEALFKRALAIQETVAEPDPANAGRTLNNLAWLYQLQGRYAEAEPMAVRAVAILEKALGITSPDYGRALDTLAKLFEGQGRAEEAEPMYRRALAILEDSLGPEHEGVAATRENLGGLLKSQGRLDDAEPLLQAALDTKERVFGAGHSNVANSLAQLGDLYRLQGKSDEAEPLFQRALAIRKAAIRQVPVFFATNRQLEQGGKTIAFGVEPAGTLTFGQAAVMVAKPQALLGLAQFDAPTPDGTPVASAPKIETTEVARLAIHTIDVMPDSHLVMAAAEQRVVSASVFPKQVFVFVHGFNVSFENALRRTAQIAYDLNFDGAPFVFSWPSRGSLLSYASDRESAEEAANYLKEFLEKIISETHATKINLIAHSMGNVVLLNALEKIKLSSGPQSNLRFAEIILHSPDVSTNRFAQLMKAINGLGTNVTLYVATSDRALGLSAWLWGVVGRAGAVPAVVAGVETIDVTAAGSSLLGLNHDLYATNPAIFNDMRLVLELGKHPPDQRSPAFEPTVTENGTYWQFRRQISGVPASTPGP